MAKDAVSGISRVRPTTVVPTKPPPPPSGAVKLVKKATERLEEDAKEMEDRLAQLRLSMLEEKKKRDKELPVKHGSRWRSAREDRGSVSKYAQDVQNNKLKVDSSGGKKPSSDPDTKSITKKSKKTKKQSSGNPNKLLDTIPSVATVSKWTTNQVLEWLSAIRLEEFQPSFEYHQITGGTLLELTLNEFMQIGVTKLSARNILYTEIGKIRDKSSPGGDERHQSIEIIDPKLRDVNPEVHSPQSKTVAGAGRVHWSQLKPLSETTVALGGNGEIPANLADDEFDEDESHASFMKALLEWRSTDNGEQAQGDIAGDSDGKEEEELWVNPMLRFANEEEEEKEPDGGALLDGSYDEEKEKEAFRKAVEAWRIGASESSTTSSSNKNIAITSVEQIEQGCTAAQRKSCWQCYHVVNVDSLIVDDRTRKLFCSAACQSVYHQEYSRFYQKQ